MNRRRLSLVALAALALGPVVTTAIAATPASGTVGPRKPSVTWQGQTYAVGATAGGTADSAAACPPVNAGGQPCDVFTITSDVPASYWTGKKGGLTVSITWPDASNDFDLYAYNANGDLVASSASSAPKETLTIDKAVGAYEIRVAPFLVVDSGYTGTGTFASAPQGGDPAPVAAASYRGLAVATSPKAEPRTTAIAPFGPPLVLQTVDIGREAAEPTIGVDKKGAAFVAAGAFDALPDAAPVGLARTEIYRSKDGGKTFQDITNNLGRDSNQTSLDPYVYVEEDSGRVFNVDLAGAGAFIPYSDDQGETFTPSVQSGDPFVNDHQTLFAGPVPEGQQASLDPKFAEYVYYCFNRVSDVGCVRSIDGGRTYQKSGLPAFTGVDAEYPGELCGSLHGHIVTDRQGRLLLPKGHCGQPWLAVSEDAGTTWTRTKVSNTVSMPDNQSSVAVDDRGNVFYVWYDGEHKLPYLAVSTDHGKTFGKAIMIAPPGVHEVNWPTIAAGAAGRIVVSFPGTTASDSTDLSRPWDLYVTTSTNALSDNPTFTSTIANTPGDPLHRGACDGRCGNMFDFLDVLAAPTPGAPIWGTAVDTCTDKLKCNKIPAAGYDGTSDGVSVDMRGLVYRQMSGPQLRPVAGGAQAPAPQGPPPAAPAPQAPAPTGGGLAATGPLLPASLAVALLLAGLVVRRMRAV
jgi:photosystem II stability/assembly factor-like uncharacterized protein